MRITATNEKSPDEVSSWRTYRNSQWSAVRLVAWISQDSSTLKTTVYFKWQNGADNYYCYWNDSHPYNVTLDGQTITDNFSLPRTSNGWRDLSTAKSIVVTHDSSGAYTGTLHVTGYKYWEAFTDDISIELPTITSPVTPVTPDDPGVPIVNDSDHRYYIFADGKVLYSVDVNNHAVVRPKLELNLNNVDSLEFTIPENNELYSSLDKLRTTIEVKQGTEVLFRGRILNDDTDFNKLRRVHCEGALSFLGDTLKAPYDENAYTTAKDFFKACIDEHSSQVPVATPYRKLKYVRCNLSSKYIGSSEDYKKTSDCISDLLNSVSGGYLKLEYYDNGETGLSLLNSYDHKSSQRIQFGKNLLDLDISIDASDVYTSVIALGKKDSNTKQRITTGSGASMYTESADAIELFGRIIRVFTFDDIEDQAELRKTAQEVLKLGLETNVTISASAVDLHLVDADIEKIRIGDSVRITSAPHDIDSYFQCTKISLDFANPENTVYTFGAKLSSITDRK